ncbi:unnamed protein product [Rhizophagus irregularis]|nr:unnamed protein product [Rhizophagus irregularis]CAB5363588.1 unnamed protein product [Rhizophagus irregularis]
MTVGSLDAIHDACPLRRSRRSIRDSLCDILYGDETFRKSSLANIMIFGLKNYPPPLLPRLKNGQSQSLLRTARDSSPSVKQSFSFSDSEQGAIIEPFINLSEKTVSDFLANNESIIPLEVVEPFVNKQ